ncbi:MAG: TonB-dependent receptor domain-containing protein [Saprospiraceae bacterium]
MFFLKKSIISTALVCGLVSGILAQDTLLLRGIAAFETEERLIGAAVYWKDTRVGTRTDTLGQFVLPHRATPGILTISYPGIPTQEIEILPDEHEVWIEVSGGLTLGEVSVEARQFDTRTSTLSNRNVERITSGELKKAPCCNLSESFQTTGAVDVVYANALTGIKEIQMLGLRGIYSQFMLEGRPTMYGIATPFAFEYIPGSWLGGIDLAKGASTARNGAQGITGQINADLVKPHTDAPVFVNLFASSEGRGEVNLHLNKRLKRGWANGLLLHGSAVQNRWDMNGDNYYDSPSRRQLNGLYRVFYETPQVCIEVNAHALTDARFGGQIRAPEGIERFGIEHRNRRAELWSKVGIKSLGGKPYNQIGNMASVSWHEAAATYGRNNYQAAQRSVYWQSLYETILGTTNHQIVLAPNLQYDQIAERLNEISLDRTEWAPGLMGEYTWSRPDLHTGMSDLAVVVGIRADWHNRFGWQWSPRASARYNPGPNTAFRLSGGRGFRSPNVVAENFSLLASNRRFEFASPIGPDVAWNYGLNVTRNFKLAGREAAFNLDLYRTDFVRQAIADVEEDPTAALFYTIVGGSYSNSLMAVLQYNAAPGLDLKAAYKWSDVQIVYRSGARVEMPLVARHRGLMSVDYVTPDKRWAFNAHAQLIGSQRLPDNSLLPEGLADDFPERTPFYPIFNAQITRTFSDGLELYLGGENLLGYHQHAALISPDDPWSPYFNASQVWAPVMRQVAYVGLRYKPL